MIPIFSKAQVSILYIIGAALSFFIFEVCEVVFVHIFGGQSFLCR
jgi:hypothetical protein